VALDDSEERMSETPNKEQVRRWLGELKSHYTARQQRNEKADEFVRNEYPVEAPMPSQDLIAEPYVFRQNRGSEIFNRAQGILNVHSNVSAEVPGKRAEEAEKWINLARAQAEWEDGEDTNAAVTKEVITKGYSAVKVLPNPRKWQGYPREQKIADARAYTKAVREFGQTAPLPFSVWHIPVNTWYPLLNGRNVIRSLECKKVTRSWIEARYGEVLDSFEHDQLKEIADEIEFVEYVDDTVCGWYVFGPEGSELSKELRVWPHRMQLDKGRAPVVLYEGITEVDPKPEYRWKGLIDDIMPSLQAQDFALSRTATVVQVFYWLTIIHRIKEGGATLEELKKTRRFTLGGTNFVLPQEELEILGLPGQLPDAEALYVRTEERIKRAFPDALQGLIDGSSSGYLYNLVRDSALILVKPIANNLAKGDAEVARLIFQAVGAMQRITRQKQLRVYVREAQDEGVKAIGVTYDQVKELGPLLRARRDADLPVDVHSKIDAAIKAWKELRLPWAHVISEIYGAENPEELEDERDLEDIERDPLVMDRTREDVFMEMDAILNEQEGLLPEEAQAMAAEQPIPPALERVLGLGGLPAGGQTGAPLAPPPALLAEPQVPPYPEPVVTEPPTAGAPRNVSRTSPRAGTRTQNKGTRRQPTKPDVRGRS
jgi:hypothetical protein